jgi:hypothetical protein
MYLHTTYAGTLAREPLGVLDAWRWARGPKDANGERGGVKQSLRWTEGYERVAERVADLPTTRLVYVADREADIAALRAQARDLGHPLPTQPRPARGRQAVGERDRGGAPGGRVFHAALAPRPEGARGAPASLGQTRGGVGRQARAGRADLYRGAGSRCARGGEAP